MYHQISNIRHQIPKLICFSSRLAVVFAQSIEARGIHQSPVDSPHKGQWRGAAMFSLICRWTNGWADNQNASALRHHHTHYDVTVMNQQEDGNFCVSLCLWGNLQAPPRQAQKRMDCLSGSTQGATLEWHNVSTMAPEVIGNSNVGSKPCL